MSDTATFHCESSGNIKIADIEKATLEESVESTSTAVLCQVRGCRPESRGNLERASILNETDARCKVSDLDLGIPVGHTGIVFPARKGLPRKVIRLDARPLIYLPAFIASPDADKELCLCDFRCELVCGCCDFAHRSSASDPCFFLTSAGRSCALSSVLRVLTTPWECKFYRWLKCKTFTFIFLKGNQPYLFFKNFYKYF